MKTLVLEEEKWETTRPPTSRSRGLPAMLEMVFVSRYVRPSVPLSLPLSPSLLPSPLPFDAFSRVNERSCRTCLVQLLQTTARTTLNLLPFQLYCFLDYVPKLYASVFYCLTTVLFFRCKRHRIFPPSRSRYFCSIYSIASISIFDNNHRLRGKFTVP